MTSGMDWQAQVGRTWADNFALTDRSFAGLTQRLLERVGERAGGAVLDVGCGAGELALAVARQRPGARVIGVDVSPDLIEAAQARGGRHGNAEFVLADAANWRMAGFDPDLVISRHGVMFFDDPVAAFANLRHGALSGASLVFSCFRSPAENQWASSIARLLDLPPAADPYAPGPFAFADADRVKAILDDAGWREIEFEPVDFAYVAGVGEDPVADALHFFRRIGPAAPALRALEGKARELAEGRIREWLEDHRSGNLVALSAAAWIASARKS
ncbi:class I SAM-dependent methyltransferase [Novosphingobium sp.]|uniref:class I SAM-dependent methyltransferase n=1 Tax=Novosphingobium sp. TaxID=1874826 RepID=UPI0035B2D924